MLVGDALRNYLKSQLIVIIYELFSDNTLVDTFICIHIYGLIYLEVYLQPNNTSPHLISANVSVCIIRSKVSFIMPNVLISYILGCFDHILSSLWVWLNVFIWSQSKLGMLQNWLHHDHYGHLDKLLEAAVVIILYYVVCEIQKSYYLSTSLS